MWVIPGGSDNKISAWNAGDLSSIPGLARPPGGEHGNPLQYSCLENPHRQSSQVGYSPQGCKGLDMTGQPSIHVGFRLSDCVVFCFVCIVRVGSFLEIRF